jgi:hypothetical protein
LELNDYIQHKLTHSIHTSERLSFRGCRRRHHWLFVDGWYPTTTPKPLEFGQAFHTAMETWYDPEMWGKDPETRLTLTLLAFRRVCTGQKNKYLEHAESNDLDTDVEQDFKERVELGEGMIRYHCTKVSPKLDVGFKPIKVEIEFEVPITGDNGQVLWCKCQHCKNRWRNSEAGAAEHDKWCEENPYESINGNRLVGDELTRIYWESWRGVPVTYGGRIDMLAEDDLGRLWIFDWKTAARMSGQEDGDAPDEYIQLDDQITSYLWALWSLGFQVAGFVHHEMKKAFPVEPEPNKRLRNGCWYSVNKMQNTSYELYLETISEGDPTGLASGAYDDFLDYLKEKGPRYYSRKQVARSEAELRNAGRNIALEAMDIIDPALRVYPSPGRFHCTFCAFRQPCLGTNRDEDVEYMFLSNYVKRSPRYWEHNKPSTDSKGGQ